MKQLTVRALSAILAGLLFLGSYLFGGNHGLLILCLALMGIGALEFSGLGLNKFGIPFSTPLFVLTSLVLLSSSVFFSAQSLPIWALGIATYITALVWLTRNKVKTSSLMGLFSLSGIGFIYCALLPATALKLLLLPHGAAWFLNLLLIVFFGDTFAYFFGRYLGRRKLMEQLSPKKTVAGAWGGLLGSMIAAVGMWKFGLHYVNPVHLILIALAANIFAQTGDLFESLMKRVANVKDSGAIMPGHGGVLDRLDGVLFAAPVVFAYSYFISLPRL